MKKLTLIIAIVFSGMLFMQSCSVEYEQQREMILENVQTLEEGNVLDLNAKIINIEFDTILTTADSLVMLLNEWPHYTDSIAMKYIRLTDSCDFVEDSILALYDEDITKLATFEYGTKGWDDYMVWAGASDFGSIFRKAKYWWIDKLDEEISYHADKGAYKYLEDLKSRNATYPVYKCTYKALNPAFQVDQTITKHFVFNKDQTKIIRKY